MPEFEIDIAVNSQLWESEPIDFEKLAETTVKHIFQHLLPTPEIIEISIVLADDAFIQKLNKDYRGKDKPTNVLSFPITEPDEFDENEMFISLGDIIIAFETIQTEAQEQGKSIHDHFTHMLVHGCLHLMHYDHMNEEDAEEMEAMEIEILDALGVKNPYNVL